ncbi:MAG: RDD family protein [Gammaproteobacteria bacterium]|nr:RDD family protein [Gammaproteobacteria bacterium]
MAAIVYDGLLLLAALFGATAIALPLNDGEAFNSHQYGFSVYLLLVCFSFFGWFWTHGGQTPGMKAWQLKLVAVSSPNAAITWTQAVKRFLASILSWLIIGGGFIAIVFSAKKLAWHDRLSQSSIVFNPKQA